MGSLAPPENVSGRLVRDRAREYKAFTGNMTEEMLQLRNTILCAGEWRTSKTRLSQGPQRSQLPAITADHSDILNRLARTAQNYSELSTSYNQGIFHLEMPQLHNTIENTLWLLPRQANQLRKATKYATADTLGIPKENQEKHDRNCPGKLDEINYHLSKADGRKLQVLCSVGYSKGPGNLMVMQEGIWLQPEIGQGKPTEQKRSELDVETVDGGSRFKQLQTTGKEAQVGRQQWNRTVRAFSP